MIFDRRKKAFAAATQGDSRRNPPNQAMNAEIADAEAPARLVSGAWGLSSPY